jgi:hypothetical protein
MNYEKILVIQYAEAVVKLVFETIEQKKQIEKLKTELDKF